MPRPFSFPRLFNGIAKSQEQTNRAHSPPYRRNRRTKLSLTNHVLRLCVLYQHRDKFQYSRCQNLPCSRDTASRGTNAHTSPQLICLTFSSASPSQRLLEHYKGSADLIDKMGWVHNTNTAVARSAVGRYFRLEGSGHVRKDI